MNTESRCPHCYEDMTAAEIAAGSCDRCRTEPVHRGFSRAELSVAFDSVKNPQNWKMPINTVLRGTLTDRQVQTIAAAVEFYAGCKASFIRTAAGTKVEAVGYYQAVGA